jgi:co-chaperonin GroES (HSP10)
MFKPVNRHILVDYSPPEAKPESGILLPDDYVAPTEDYVTVDVLGWADDVVIPVHEESQVIIDKKMLEKITVEHSNYYLILENYVIGVID